MEKSLLNYECETCKYQSNDIMEFVTDEDLTEAPICRDCWENMDYD